MERERAEAAVEDEKTEGMAAESMDVIEMGEGAEGKEEDSVGKFEAKSLIICSTGRQLLMIKEL